MATIIVNHKVTDYNSWKSSFEADAERRNAMGSKLLAVGQKINEPGSVYVVFDVENPDVLSQAFADPELQKRMADAGVLSTETTVFG